MKYKLIKEYADEQLKKYSALEIILMNRGIKLEDIPHYCNTTDEDINSPLLFGEEVLRDAATALEVVVFPIPISPVAIRL